MTLSSTVILFSIIFKYYYFFVFTLFYNFTNYFRTIYIRVTYFIINGFFFETHPTYSTVRLEEAKNAKDAIYERYCLSETEELVFLSEDVSDIVCIIDYTYKGSIITFEQRSALYQVNLDTERRVVEPVDVDEFQGFYIGTDTDNSILEWYQDGYTFTIYGKLHKEDALNLAFGTKIK